jgi:hypothetical protein
MSTSLGLTALGSMSSMTWSRGSMGSKVVWWYKGGMLLLGGDWYATWWLGATGAAEGPACGRATGAAEGPACGEGENKKLDGGS